MQCCMQRHGFRVLLPDVAMGAQAKANQPHLPFSSPAPRSSVMFITATVSLHVINQPNVPILHSVHSCMDNTSGGTVAASSPTISTSSHHTPSFPHKQ